MSIYVELPHHSYEIIVKKGALATVGQWVAGLWTPQQVCVVTDDTVDGLYGNMVVDQLEAQGFIVIKAVIEAGEASKSLENAEKIYQLLTANQFTRSDGILALGGGVVGDLAGFVAATFMRGIHFLQIPTTLLAQVDSSIGGKTAVNTNYAKNIIGAFWQPDGVLIDPDTLGTLEDRRVSEGIAEVIKYAAIADKQLWDLLTTLPNKEAVRKEAEKVIHACLAIKKAVVEADEFDHGQRLILNFGHTIGHAVEKTAGYGVVTHGEAVSIGMIQISRIAENKGLSPKGITQALDEMVRKFDLPVETTYWPEDVLFEAITHDKKARGKKINLVLLKQIGEAFLSPTPVTKLHDYLKKEEK
ncbi:MULTISPECIES: 3-dehydroquinate synthase [unclassified Enterococcus]|uniref:3-dehydroquinate synthase n=1 Tax=unclassified Enterococcus TaxID=2608891 RepID=UPI0013ED2657|nr:MULTISPECIES: 3-dehydroquinate synthase [unclassified Enterococcus]